MKFFGIIGMICVQGSTIFQLVKFLRYKTSRGVSVGFWWAILIGLSCYLVYSIHIHDPIYITSNTIGICLTICSLFLYYKYRRNDGL
jgi:lipid-A-disaccharide synthase-like uncharacterized protein